MSDWPVVYPEYGLPRDSADVRSFDFGGQDGDWWVASDWHASPQSEV